MNHPFRQLGSAALLIGAAVVAAAQAPPPDATGTNGSRGTVPMARWGSDFTPGWSLMTEQERIAHRERMRSMNSHEECQRFHEQHHEQMMARAKERRAPRPVKPRHDPCVGLRK